MNTVKLKLLLVRLKYWFDFPFRTYFSSFPTLIETLNKKIRTFETLVLKTRGKIYRNFYEKSTQKVKGEKPLL